MKNHQILQARWLLVQLLLLCLALGEAKKRGERPLGETKKIDEAHANTRKLGINVFDAAELRTHLVSQRTEYKDPFENEPRISNVQPRTNSYELARHKTQTTSTVAVNEKTVTVTTEVALDEVLEEEPILDIELSGKGKGGKGSGGDSRSKGSKSKSKGKGEVILNPGKSMKSSHSMNYTPFPTFPTIPTTVPAPNFGGSSSPVPTTSSGLTEKPSCPPSTGFFPPDVSDFFGQPPVGGGNDLQNELNNALNEIQVPGTFSQQCAV